MSRICAALDAEVEAFRCRPLADERVSLPLARRHVPQGPRGRPGRVDGGPRRDRGRANGRAPDPGPRARRRQRRGLAPGRRSSARSSSAACAGVRLVISDDHAGLVKAVREQLLGSAWQRCRVHFTRNAQDLVPRSARSMVASAIRLGVRAARRGARPASSSTRVIDSRAGRASRAVAELLTDAEPDLLAHFTFPETHRRQIRSTNPLERLNKEIKRRTGGRRHLPQPGERSSASSA